MKRAIFLVLALFGLAVQAQDAEAVRWGGPEASAPVASAGVWVPYQAARMTALGQFVGTSPLFGSTTINGDFTIVGSARCLYLTGGRICSNGATELDLYGGSLAQILLVPGNTYFNNSTNVRGTMTWTAGYVASGSNAIAFGTDGQRLDLGTGVSDYFVSDGSNLSTPAGFQAGAAGFSLSGTWDIVNDGAGQVLTRGYKADGATSKSFRISSGVTLSTAGAKIVTFENNLTEKANIDKDGFLASATSHTLTSAYVNALLATGTTYAGHTVAKPFTVTDVTLYVSVASTATAANQVFTITDGTNTCTATFACNTSTNTTGTKTVTVANGAGTGCVYAANAALSFSLTTQGCATAATVKNVDIVGKWQ